MNRALEQIRLDGEHAENFRRSQKWPAERYAEASKASELARAALGELISEVRALPAELRSPRMAAALAMIDRLEVAK